jgi:hypothetical protein
MEQLILHLFGDYLTQSDWMAQNKTKAAWPAMVHAFVYGIPFFVLARHSPNLHWAMFAIIFSHFLIDHYRLARYVVWAKNFLGPKEHRYVVMGANDVFEGDARNFPFEWCKVTGYPPDRPVWLATWLLIIADNTLHLAINYVALRWL